MAWSRLDTSSWNLSLGLAAMSVLAACGPFVILEGETDTDADTGPGDTTDASPSPSEPGPTTTPPAQCYDSVDCEPGYECIGNVCVPDDYCSTGYCCYDECCYGGCYYQECYFDEECGPLGLCELEYGYVHCVYPYELPECDDAPGVGAVELPRAGDGEIVSLSFVDANGDTASDLVVGRGGDTELHWGADLAPSELLPVPGGQAVLDAVSGDFDADGDQDIAVSTLEGSLVVLAGNGAGDFVFVQEIAFGETLFDLTALQWNGDGALDLAGRTSSGGVLLQLNSGTGGFGRGVSLPVGEAHSLAPLDYGGDEYGDLAVQHSSGLEVFLGDFSGDLTPDVYLSGEEHGFRQLLSGVLGDVPPDEVIGYTRVSNWLLLELWVDGAGLPQRYALLGDDGLAAAGDYDGDGVTDVITSGGSALSYVRGSIENGYPSLACRSPYFFGGFWYTMAAGDFDGNGLADVALDLRGGTVMVLLSF